MPTDFELTKTELAVVTNFVAVIGNYGIKGALKLRLPDHGETWADALDDAIDDLVRTCKGSRGMVGDPRDVYLAAPSLALVVLMVKELPDDRSILQFPEDFVPSDELVRKCLDRYFQHARELNAGAFGQG